MSADVVGRHGHVRPNTIHIVQGEYAVSDNPGVVLSTLLGSCVAACIRDPEIRTGGINHFLLPEGHDGSASLSYGVNAMELLINDLLRRGARKDRLQAKLFGGASMIKGVGDIGRQNADFARRFLEIEGIALVGGSLEGDRARRIEFWPATGRVRQQAIDQSDQPVATEGRLNAPAAPEAAGSLELF